MRRFAGPSVLGMAFLLILWCLATPSAAQSQPAPVSTQPSRSSPPAPRAPRPRVPPPRPFGGRAEGATPTVTAIEAFLTVRRSIRLPSEWPAAWPWMLPNAVLTRGKVGQQGASSEPMAPAAYPGGGGLALQIKAAPLEPTDQRFPINLATALRLSDARPLIVAAAQASVWVAEAQLTRAKLLWVPTLIFGADYIRHDGGGPDINKGVMTVDSANFFYAGPGLYQSVNLTDVFFEPLAARQVLDSRHWDIQAAKNDALMMTADAYFKVHQYRGMYAGALYCVERGHDLIERIAHLSRELVPTVEVDRARNMVADLEQQATSAREYWRISSADLTQVLRLDPRAVVVPLEQDHLQVTLIDPGRSLEDLMPIALANRPEIASQRALVLAAEARLRREKMRPALPVIMLNGFQSAGMYIQGGIFGLGPNSSLNQFVGRADVSTQLVWQLEGLGFGNLAKIKNQRGEQSKAIIQFYRTQDMVAAEVNRALAHLQSAAARVEQADRALRTGLITFNGHMEGIGQTTRLERLLIMVYRPQEAVYSLQLLKVAFDEYYTTVADYNRAEFELFHALGYPAAEVANLRPVGELAPVETNRPAYLPPVGNGPPPATR